MDWGFNGWGGKYAPIAKDQALAGAIARHVGAQTFTGPMILEGGSLSVDGQGSLITTEECLLNPNRNPGLNREQIEANLNAYLGIHKVIWLGDGLPGDETDGHVDNVACFVRPGVAMALHPYAPELRRHGLEVIEMPPAPEYGIAAMSYMNFYVANGGIVMPGFGAPEEDKAARAAVKAAFPERQVVQVPTLPISHGGGNIHCITQQQPMG